MKISNNIEKLSRAKAYELIRDRIVKADLDLTSDDVTFTRAEAEALFMHFAPKAPAKPKTGWDWMRKATNEKDKRLQCRYVYYDGHRVYATDGHILLKTTAEAAGLIDPGFYCPKTGAPVDLDCEPLSYERLLVKPETAIEKDWTDWERIADGKLTKRKTPAGVLFNEALLRVGAPDGRFIAERMPADHHQTLQGRSDFGLFVVMPMRY